jgi:ABC-type uncharacterized transport system involved in gliding motility auxiliary subunit
MKFSAKVLAIALLFVGLVLVNYLASQIPLRGDATAEKIYTLSEGTKSLLAKIEEPVTLDLYFSRNVRGLPITYKNYADRVEEMLRQYARASRGKVLLNIIRPEADTPEEEQATLAGLQPQVVPTTREQLFFGLVATQADQQKSIPALNPNREQFLEYDLSQLIYSVQQFDKRRLGLLTTLPLKAPPFNPMMMQQGRMPEDQFVIGEWQRTFEIVDIQASATELPADLDALAVIHPQNVSERLQFAIDQFLLSGKPVFLAVDPSSQHSKRQGGQMAMFGGPQPNAGSDLPKLLGAWGITYNAQNVVGDLAHATQVQVGRGQIARFPVWLSLPAESLNTQAMPTAQLSSLLFVEPGHLEAKEGNDLSFTPLIQSSDDSGDVPAFSLQFAQPDDIARQIKASGKKTLAALVTGTFKTAFPEGAPKDEAASDDEHDHEEEAVAGVADPGPGSATPATTLREGRGTLIIVADTDWLLDDYSVRRLNFLGVQAAEPINDNLAFGSNSLEFLAGSQDLISIRGKGSSLRPFTVVRSLELEAQRRYQDRLNSLETSLSDVQKKLTELQGQATEGNRLVASPEVAQAIEEFQRQQVNLRRERREIRRALREDIDQLKTGLLLVNLLAAPVLVGGFGAWFYRRRKS